MSEDSTPVQALAYLQTEVSSVVDHSDSEEAKVFRSLLSHLLTPTPKPAAASTAPSPSVTPPQDADNAARNRRQSPPGAFEDSGDEDAVMVDIEADTGEDAGTDAPASRPVVSFQRDPEVEASNGEHTSPSPERYRQRTGVFERLMEFVNEDARQPEQDLWDMIDVDHLEDK